MGIDLFEGADVWVGDGGVEIGPSSSAVSYFALNCSCFWFYEFVFLYDSERIAEDWLFFLLDETDQDIWTFALFIVIFDYAVLIEFFFKEN